MHAMECSNNCIAIHALGLVLQLVSKEYHPMKPCMLVACNSIGQVSVILIYTDHVAVALYLTEDFRSLKLHFPAKWQSSHDDPQFQSTDPECNDYMKNPGGVANRYHKLFSTKIGENSLLQIKSAIDLGATVTEHKGFHKRNTAVAQSSYLLAFTWGEGKEPKRGGTHNTWMQCKGTRLHIPLSSLASSPGKQKGFPVKAGAPKAKSPVKILMPPDAKGASCYKRKQSEFEGTKSPPCKQMKMTMYNYVQEKQATAKD